MSFQVVVLNVTGKLIRFPGGHPVPVSFTVKIQQFGGAGVGHWTLEVGGRLFCIELLTSGQIVYRTAEVVAAALTPSLSESSPRSGALHVTKECSQYTRLAGGFCTITSSNLKDIEVGTRVVYAVASGATVRSEEHTSELQSLAYLVCRLLLEKKKKTSNNLTRTGSAQEPLLTSA